MKYGKELLERQVADWSKHYIDYGQLKKWIKVITECEAEGMDGHPSKGKVSLLICFLLISQESWLPAQLPRQSSFRS